MNLLFFLKPGLYVSKGTVIKGNITTDANGSVAGTIYGDVVTHAMLTVEKSGLVTGNAHAKNVIVKGKIKGNVHSDGKVDIIKNGEIDGHVYAIEVNVADESLLKGGITKLDAANDTHHQKGKDILSEDITPIITNNPAKEDETPQSWF